MLASTKFSFLAVISSALLTPPCARLFADDLTVAAPPSGQIHCPQGKDVSTTYYPHTDLAGYQAISDSVNFWKIDEARKDYKNIQFTAAEIKADGDEIKLFCYYVGLRAGTDSHRELVTTTGGYQVCSFADGTQTCNGTIDLCVLSCP